VERNNVTAAALLLRTNLPAAHRGARQAHKADPENPAFACTYAFSRILPLSFAR